MERLTESDMPISRSVQAPAAALVLAGLLLSSLYSYPLFHTFAELFSIVVAFAMFMMVWNSRRYFENSYLQFIGIAYLFIALIDLAHTLAYKGINVFEGYDADLPTQLWIAGRYLQGLSLLVAPFAVGKRLNYPVLFTAYAAVTAAVLGSIFGHIFPVCYIEGSGLTPFKVISEYIIALIFGASIVLLFRKRNQFDPGVLRLVVWSIAFSIAGELAFTFYISVYGLSNLIGHFFKIIACYLIYRAIIVTGLMKPYALLFRNLKESETRYRSLFGNMIDGFAYHKVVLDKNGDPVDYIFLEVNDAFERLTGLQREHIAGKKVTEVLPGIERDPADWIGTYGKVALKGEEVKFETRSGALGKWFSVTAYSPERGYFAAVFEDITERKRMEREIMHLASFPEMNPDPIAELDPEGNVTYANPSMRKQFPDLQAAGRSHPLLVNWPVMKTEFEEGGRPSLFLEVETGGRTFYQAVYYARQTNLIRIYNADVTERKRAEDELQKYRDHLEALVDERTRELKSINEELEQEIGERRRAEKRTSASATLLKLLTKVSSRKKYLDAVVKLIRTWSGCRCVGIRILGREGDLPYESYIGFSREFWESENALALGRDHCVCTRIISGKPESQDLPVMTSSGSFCTNNALHFLAALSEQEKTRYRGVCIKSGFLSIAVIPVRYGDEIIAAVHCADEREDMLPPGFIGFFETITPLIGEAIHKLDAEAERARLIAAVESAADAMVITDHGGAIQYANPAFERLTGYGKDEIAGRHLSILRSDKYDAAFHDEIWKKVERDLAWSGQVTSRKKDGTLYEEDITISAVKGPSGEVQNYVVVKRDVTEKLRLEAIAEAVNTMNNMGYIISGIRHEIGNPVNSMKMVLNVLKANLGSYSHAAVIEYIERILGELGRIDYLLRNLKSFNMYENPDLQNVPLPVFMDKLLALVKNDFTKKGVRISLSVSPGADGCSADPRALQQVLLNVLTNALDACGGRPDPEIAVTVERFSGIIVIRVTDNGCGMTGEQQKDLFKPFRTTKAHGTGLGLVIARKMMVKMNGNIEVMSRLHEGTTVSMYIPGVKHES